MVRLLDPENVWVNVEDHWSRAVNQGAVDGVAPFVGKSVVTMVDNSVLNLFPGWIKVEVDVVFRDNLVIRKRLSFDSYRPDYVMVYETVRDAFAQRMVAPENNVVLGEN